MFAFKISFSLSKRATSLAHLTNFSFEFFYEIFTEDASLPLLYQGAKKSKMTKNSNQGGSCLNCGTQVTLVPLYETLANTGVFIKQIHTYTSNILF